MIRNKIKIKFMFSQTITENYIHIGLAVLEISVHKRTGGQTN